MGWGVGMEGGGGRMFQETRQQDKKTRLTVPSSGEQADSFHSSPAHVSTMKHSSF